MKNIEKQRIQSLIKQLTTIVGQFQECVSLMENNINNIDRASLEEPLKVFTLCGYGYDLKKEETPNNAIKNLNTQLTDIYDSLDQKKDNTVDIDFVRSLVQRIKHLEKLNYNFGNYKTVFEATFGQYVVSEMYATRDFKSPTNTNLEQLSNILATCFRNVLRVVDIIVSSILRSEKNYNDKGETPLALYLTGRTQFLSPHVTSVHTAFKELQKTNDVLAKTYWRALLKTSCAP
jgi:hypothetical protein